MDVRGPLAWSSFLRMEMCLWENMIRNCFFYRNTSASNSRDKSVICEVKTEMCYEALWDKRYEIGIGSSRIRMREIGQTRAYVHVGVL